MEQLREAQIDIVNLIYYDGFTSEEAAEKTASSSAAVRKQLQRIREQLRNCLQHKAIQRGEIYER